MAERRNTKRRKEKASDPRKARLIRLPLEVDEALFTLAMRAGVSMNDMHITLLREALAARTQPS